MDCSAPRRKVDRRFTLLDGMILVAASAGGLGVDAAINAFLKVGEKADVLEILWGLNEQGRQAELAMFAMILSLPIAGSLTLALIPLGLISGRPRLRRLAGRPGWMAACAFGVSLAFASAVIGGLVASDPGQAIWPVEMSPLELSPLLPVILAPSILVTWLSLILGRRWRPEPTWLDRLGRALGVFWIAMAIVGPVLIAVAYF